jgi:drug/metabolite transporter (DMT)-like permease
MSGGLTAVPIPGGITPVLLFFLFLNAAALAVGQLLFKSSAIGVGGLPFPAMVAKIAFVPSFYAACLLYAAATVLWVWILTKLPLSTAYPFVGLSFVMVALAGWCFLGETPSIRGWIGVLMVAAGVALVASSAGAEF